MLLIKPLINSCHLLSFLLPLTKHLITLYCHIIIPTFPGDVQFDRACFGRYGYFLREQHVVCPCTNDTVYTVFERVEVVGHMLSMCVCVSNNEAEDQNLLGNCVVCCVSSSDKICALLQLYTV
jgi:hypothetical protein